MENAITIETNGRAISILIAECRNSKWIDCSCTSCSSTISSYFCLVTTALNDDAKLSNALTVDGYATTTLTTVDVLAIDATAGNGSAKNDAATANDDAIASTLSCYVLTAI